MNTVFLFTYCLLPTAGPNEQSQCQSPCCKNHTTITRNAPFCFWKTSGIFDNSPPATRQIPIPVLLRDNLVRQLDRHSSLHQPTFPTCRATLFRNLESPTPKSCLYAFTVLRYERM